MALVYALSFLQVLRWRGKLYVNVNVASRNDSGNVCNE